jgi:DoxX-like family
MPNLRLIRAAVALVWLYQGFWCKLLGRMPRHEAVIGAARFLSASQAHAALLILGAFECILAGWVLTGRQARKAALAETALLLAMNTGGILWASRIIPDPVGMLLHNFAFVLLAWVATGESSLYDRRA